MLEFICRSVNFIDRQILIWRRIAAIMFMTFKNIDEVAFMDSAQEQTVTLNLAINLDVSQLAGFLKNHLPVSDSTHRLVEPALTLQEAAKLLACSDQKVRDLVNRGDIPASVAFRVGSLYRFHRRELMEWVKRSA